MRINRAISLLLSATLLAAPAAAFAAKDDKDMSAAEYEAKLIEEGKAKDGRMLAPAPPPEAPPVAPVAPPAEAPTLDATGVAAGIVFAVVGILLFADVRRHSKTRL